MGTTYTYNRRRSKHRLRHALIAFLLAAIIVALGLAGLEWAKHQPPKSQHAAGAVVLVPQQTTTQAMLNITEPTFTMQLPADWQQTAATDTASQHSITWQATAKNQSNRWLTVYIDTIPTTTPVNEELPLTVSGNQLSYGQLSANCSEFTPGGTQDTGQAEKLQPAPSVWQGVNFICDLPRVIDNQVGTGSAAGVNTVTVTGPKAGTHRYFFFYTDHNIEPDYTILFDAIQSFRAT